jgi:hypothetical protein
MVIDGIIQLQQKVAAGKWSDFPKGASPVSNIE